MSFFLFLGAFLLTVSVFDNKKGDTLTQVEIAQLSGAALCLILAVLVYLKTEGEG